MPGGQVRIDRFSGRARGERGFGAGHGRIQAEDRVFEQFVSHRREIATTAATASAVPTVRPSRATGARRPSDKAVGTGARLTIHAAAAKARPHGYGPQIVTAPPPYGQ